MMASTLSAQSLVIDKGIQAIERRLMLALAVKYGDELRAQQLLTDVRRTG